VEFRVVVSKQFMKLFEIETEQELKVSVHSNDSGCFRNLTSLEPR